MSRKSKNNFRVVGDVILIKHPNWDFVACTTYRKDYYDELTSITWTNVNGYLRNKSLGSLHSYIVSKWYGKNVLEDMTKNNYIVDHMNNNHADCRISNLEFLKKSYNTAKGQTLDVDSKNMKTKIAVNIFKDFSTKCYQTTIGCNDSNIKVFKSENIEYDVSEIRLLYNCDYSIVINDAENILRLYDTEGKIDVSNTNSCDVKIEKNLEIELTEEDKNKLFIEHDGERYIIIDGKTRFLTSVPFEKGWKSPNK